MRMHSTIFSLACWIALSFASAGAADVSIVDVRKIWDAGKHNAFTDLVHFRGRFWCTFREADAHVGGDGKIRVITSMDGSQWDSAALLEENGVDLRDPKFSIMPDGRLMIVAGGSVYGGTKKLQSRRPRVLFSVDGYAWTRPEPILAEGAWLWRVTWREGRAYGVSYDSSPAAASTAAPSGNGSAAADWTVKLYESDDGLHWKLIAPLAVSGKPNETTLRFLRGGEMVAMVRRENGSGGTFGVAQPPYEKWIWHDVAERLGGPNFIELPDGELIATTRDYRQSPRHTTLVARVKDWKLEPLATLPSGGDTSYAGMLWHDGLLWVSYYSSHEGKASIYLARLNPPAAKRAAE